MTPNLGSTDRKARFGAGLALILLAIFGGFGAGATWGLAIVGLVLAATAGLRFCPAYRLLGVNTCRS